MADTSGTAHLVAPVARPSSVERSAVFRVLAASFLVPVLAVGCFWLVWGDFHSFLVATDHTPIPFADFQKYYWKMGRELFWLRQPVFGFLYSPFFALLMVPLGRLPLREAVWTWGGIQAVSTWLFLALPAQWFLRRSERLAYAYLVVAAFSYPLVHNFRWGQVGVLVTLPVFVAARACAHGKTTRAAVILGLSCAVKLYTGIFALYFLFRRDWEAIIMFAVTVAACVFIFPVFVLGREDTIAFYTGLRDMMDLLRPGIEFDPNTQNLPNVAMRLARRAEWRGFLEKASYVVFAGGLYGVWRFARSLLDPVRAAALLLMLTPLVVTTTWSHYFVFLPFCQVLAWSCSSRWATLGRWGQRTLIVASVLLASTPLFWLIGDHLVHARRGYVLMADILLLAVFVWQSAETADMRQSGDQPVPLLG